MFNRDFWYACLVVVAVVVVCVWGLMLPSLISLVFLGVSDFVGVFMCVGLVCWCCCVVCCVYICLFLLVVVLVI